MNRVLSTIENHIATVTLNRPEKMNALDDEMFKQIITVGKEISENPSIRCVVLTGAGTVFSAGLDTKMFGDPDAFPQPGTIEARTHGIANRWQEVSWVWRRCPVPVIAAIHGIAFGGGLQILSGADIKFVHPKTRLSILEMKWGIIPDMAGTQLWRHNVREDVLKELTFTNREFSGEEAVHFGFATHVSVNPMEDAQALAKTISSKSPTAIVKAKRLFNNAPYLNEEEGLMLESKLQGQILLQHNQVETVMAQMMKRTPEYKDFRES